MTKIHKEVTRSTTASPTTDNIPVRNRGLGAARMAKQDEFYTQYEDIEKEVEAYLEFDPDTFHGKVVYCNCDDPFESDFFRYLAIKFNTLHLKKLIATSYDGSPIAGQLTLFPEYNEGNGKRKKPKALAVILDHVKDENGDGAANIDDVKLILERNANRTALKADDKYPGGDFRSAACVELLKQADIVVTNPPFSLFREYVAQLVECGKKFLIIGNTNSITYKDIFPLIKDNRVWLGCTNFNVGMFFEVPAHWERFHHINQDTGRKIARVSSSCWYTNLDHGRRHQPLKLMTMAENLKFSKNLRGKTAYDRYANYDAIEVGTYKEIPSDYDGAMGVPITFIDKYNPDQFEILGSSMNLGVPMSQVAPKGSYSPGGPRFYIDNGDGTFRRMYDRIVIRHRRTQPTKGKK